MRRRRTDSEGPGPDRHRGTDDELLDVLKEDMRLQREAEERRAQESRERMEAVLYFRKISR